jgi:hypothetical protein
MILNINPEHPFYRPLWVRIALVAVLAGWALLEFSHRSFFWGTIAAGLCLYVIYELLWRYHLHQPKPDDENEAPIDGP